MLKNRSGRTGFTLPEVLVTVAIVAVLAAVVVPTVTSQIGKGDDTNLVTNLSALRTAITAFVSDVRKFPSRLQHLAVQPLAADSGVKNNTYGAAAVARWKGPYQQLSLKAENLAAPADSARYGGLAYALDVLADTTWTNGAGLVVTLTGISSTVAAMHIDSLLDPGTDSTTGNVRWSGISGSNRIKLLLMGDK